MTGEPMDLSSSVFSIYGRPGVSHHYSKGEESQILIEENMPVVKLLASDSMHAKAAPN